MGRLVSLPYKFLERFIHVRVVMPNLKQCIRRALGCKPPDLSNLIEGIRFDRFKTVKAHWDLNNVLFLGGD
jgi:hypothetical protein